MDKRLDARHAWVMLSILIVNQDGTCTIDACIESVIRHVGVHCEVVVAGETGSLGAAEGLEVKRVPAGPELTFAAAMNMAASRATGEYLLLLANDSVLLNSIAEAIRVLDADPAIGVVGANMYNHQGGYLSACALFPTPMRLWSFTRMWQVPVDTWKLIDGVEVRRCDYVDASFLLTRADAWRAVNGMNQANSVYGDEMDFCRTLRDAGYLTVQVPTIHYAHAGGYAPERMARLFAGFRRYHRRFSGPFTRLQAEVALRSGLVLRLPLLWLKSLRGGEPDRLAFHYALQLHRNWSETESEVSRGHAPKP